MIFIAYSSAGLFQCQISNVKRQMENLQRTITGMTRRNEQELEELEIELLIEGLYRHYGIDLRLYERASLRLRIHECIRQEQTLTVSGLQEKVLHDSECL